MNFQGVSGTINIMGPVSVQIAHDELKHQRTPGHICLLLLIGHTGSGKSAFVECIGNDPSLGISKDQLQGFTQELMVYRINNVYRKGGNPIYLLDTPGFADDTFPETKILRIIQDFLKDNKIGSIKRTLYFERITDTRMTNSRNKSFEIFKAITGLTTEQNITIVTTMWDQLWSEDQRTRANRRVEDLQSTFWKSLVEDGTPVVKFENHHESAMEVLEKCLDSFATYKYFILERMLKDNVTMSNTTAGTLLYQNLLERRSGLQQRARHLDDGLEDAYAQADPLIQQVLREERDNVMAIATTVEQELKILGPPSSLESGLVEPKNSSEFQAHNSSDAHKKAVLFRGQSVVPKRIENLVGWTLKVRQLWRRTDRPPGS